VTPASYNLSDRNALDAALSDLRGYWKFWSSCLLQTAALPTLRGLIITRRTRSLKQDIRRFLEEIDEVTALFRHDRKREAPPYPRGGFLVPEELIDKVVDYYLGLDRIVALFEPADPLRNGYNINVLFQSELEIWAEITGPGFDASDLQRGDLSPHEVFAISLGEDGQIRRSQQVYRADNSIYDDSKRTRRDKVRRTMKNVPTPTLATAIRRGLLRGGRQRVRAQSSYPKEYQPIPRELVHRTIKAIVRSSAIDAFRQNTGVWFPLNFATSFVGTGDRQVYWDIVSPELKFAGLAVGAMQSHCGPNSQDF
jgi:hypothetical protein